MAKFEVVPSFDLKQPGDIIFGWVGSNRRFNHVTIFAGYGVDGRECYYDGGTNYTDDGYFIMKNDSAKYRPSPGYYESRYKGNDLNSKYHYGSGVIYRPTAPTNK
ncbi:MAG: hypothetical protein Q4G09_05080 [Clostridia bacterium]|nr:hypothetical protein [Clostridia bacterium]